MNREYLINAIEKVFRYFIPGFIFIFLFKLSFPSNKDPYILKNIGPVEFYIYVPCLGMVIYGIHRVFMSSLVEILLYKWNLTAVSNFASDSRKIKEYPSALADFFKARHKKENQNLSSYLFYRWSIQHYCLILSELVFLFWFYHETESIMETYKWPVFFFLLIIFILSSLFTLIMYITEKKMFGKDS